MKKFAIIVAGGSGKRMESSIPKQFLLLNNIPILLHTIQAFIDLGNVTIILVLPKDQNQYWDNLCKEFNFNHPILVCNGGKERFHSVKNGLALIKESGLVAIHDGVRPLINKSLLQKSYNDAQIFGSSVMAISLKDSIREVSKDGSSLSIDRANFKLIQTPQTFIVDNIKKAYNIDYLKFTDDASVMEHSGFPIHLTEGSYQNLKITTPEDLIFAEAMIKRF